MRCAGKIRIPAEHPACCGHAVHLSHDWPRSPAAARKAHQSGPCWRQSRAASRARCAAGGQWGVESIQVRTQRRAGTVLLHNRCASVPGHRQRHYSPFGLQPWATRHVLEPCAELPGRQRVLPGGRGSWPMAGQPLQRAASLVGRTAPQAAAALSQPLIKSASTAGSPSAAGQLAALLALASATSRGGA